MDQPTHRDDPRAQEPERAALSDHVEPDTITRSIWSGTSIPSRVLKQFELCVQDSETPKVGKGLFCLEDVKAGELIFKIKRPPMALISTTNQFCNNCLLNIKSSSDEPAARNTCGGCKVMRYCCKSCQRAAWKHYHKYECKTFEAFKTAEARAHGNRPSHIFKTTAQYIIRLVQLHNNGILGEDTETQWREFQCLPTGETWRRATNRSTMEDVENLSQFVKLLTDTPLSVDDINKQQLAMAYTWKGLLAPFLRRTKWSGPGMVHSMCIGTYVEPFANIIQRSCYGNVWIVFSGNHLCVRATRDIEAGSEILLTSPMYYDFQHRTTQINELWGTSCSCTLCRRGPLGPTGDLRQRIFDIAINDHSVKDIATVKQLIEDVHASGFTYSSDLMRHLYAAALVAYTGHMETANALKTALAMYYLIEPNTTPPSSEDLRIATLFHLIELSQPSPENTNISPIPLQLRELLRAAHMHWVYVQVIRAEKMFGADDKMIKYERMVFATRLRWLEQNFATDMNYIFIAMDTPEERQRLVVLLNGVLRWAGILPLTEEQLLTF